MIKNLKAHYQQLLRQHGPSPAAVQHVNKLSQFKRFSILNSITESTVKSTDYSIIDVGCGLGDMYEYLQDKNFSGTYLGLDFVEEFITLAQQKYHSLANVNFQQCDLQTEHIPEGYDYVLLSGVFNNKMPNNEVFMLNTLKKMFASCNKGIAFNAMSTYVDYQDEQLYYSDPLAIFDFCKKHLSKNVVLKHDYILKAGSIPFEYTIFVYREPQ
ncbi:class I SAM-dependent methyltransferase [Colwellia sp. D2M02]|uniref:class I SAM-dependent methyltransferase n=1 Tax=Colwellia sp. D2M02 TaxID=2841562 RepID=UPI001C0A2261|nr:class I SAM-dependent methyltransferase [Colwellia sp. D2M02]MBU2892945.1 class I SAM-dependent methyltransferase [Colwellia sp. D2M02]